MQPTKRTKITYVVTKGVWGGAQKYVYTLATNLPKDKFDVLVICGAGKILKEKLETAGIRVIEIDSLKRDISIISEIKSAWRLFQILRNEKSDVLHLNSPKAAGLGSTIGRVIGISNIIQTVHGFSFNEDRSALSKSLLKFFSWLTLVLCHHTIVIASQEKSQALAMPFVKAEKIELIKNGIEKINFEEKEQARSDLQTAINRNPDTWIGTICELHKNKGLEFALEALSKIDKSFAFIIIGEGEERTHLQDSVHKLGLAGKVFFLGFRENAIQYLKAFDIFTLTSLKEALPYSILEAGLAGLPVIASSVGGIPDIIENNISGLLVKKGDVSGITKALETLLNDPEKRKTLGETLKNKVESEFSIEQMLEKIIKLYS